MWRTIGPRGHPGADFRIRDVKPLRLDIVAAFSSSFERRCLTSPTGSSSCFGYLEDFAGSIARDRPRKLLKRGQSPLSCLRIFTCSGALDHSHTYLIW